MSALATVDGNSIQCRLRANVGRNTPADGEFAKAGGSLQGAAEELPNDLVGGCGFPRAGNGEVSELTISAARPYMGAINVVTADPADEFEARATDNKNFLSGGLGVDGYSLHQPAADERDPPVAADPPDYR